MSQERQIAPRIPLTIEVEFRKNYSRQFAMGTLKNISLSGAFLEESQSQFLPGDKLQMTLNVGSRVRKLAAEVVWRNTNGVGVKFHHSNNRDLQIVDDLMYFAENKRESQKDVLGNIFNKVG